MGKIISVLGISAVLAALVLGLVACAPSLTEQIALTNANANLEYSRAATAREQAASIRAEGDRAVQEAQATAITLQAMSQQNYQDMLTKLVWLQEAESTIIDNTFWAVVLAFVLLTGQFAMMGLLVWQVVALRKLRETG